VEPQPLWLERLGFPVEGEGGDAPGYDAVSGGSVLAAADDHACCSVRGAEAPRVDGGLAWD